MKKRDYSLTAKERKQLREREVAKKDGGRVRGAINTEAESSDASEAVVRKRKFNWWLIPLLACGLALVITAIVLPLTYNPYKNVSNPVAKIELSNGMVLEFEVFEDSCPIAATNFIYLAQNDFFTDTIIFDNQQGWVRFGDYVTMNKLKSTYKDNKEYLDKLPGIYENHAENPLGYRLKNDSSSDASRISEEGMLTFNYQRSSCQFFISSHENCQTKLNSTDYTPTVVGRYLNNQTLDNIKKIAEMENDPDANTVWKNPTPIITIKKVKIYNLDKKKWKNFHFEDYIEDKENDGANSALRDWYAN